MANLFADWSLDAALLLTLAGGIGAYFRPELRETIARALVGLLPLIVTHLGESWHHVNPDRPAGPSPRP